MFVVVKYLLAENIPDALKKEKNIPVDDCYMDTDWKRSIIEKRFVQPAPIGFNTNGKNKHQKTKLVEKGTDDIQLPRVDKTNKKVRLKPKQTHGRSL